jgi:CHAT domain-containing protein
VDLVVSLDADLGGLPVEAMRLRGVPLGISTRLTHAPSLAVFHGLQQRVAKRGGVLVFDSVELPVEERELHQLTDLDYSTAEGDMIAAAYADVVRRQRGRATFQELRRVLDEAGPFAIAHISCHALEHPYLPAASLLMLGDGPVEMSTLAQQRLPGALVVFSSCSSAGAQSDVASGEGMRGLLWGAFGAGARLVIASHWAMNQQATKDLMAVFHAGMARGLSCAEAMRGARATLAAAENYAHPTFWAGFGVYGPTQPAVESAAPAARSRWPYGLLALAGVLLLWRARRRPIPRAADPGPPSVSAGST